MDSGFYIQFIVISHTPVIVSYYQYYQLSYMTKVGSIVLISIIKRKIYNIIHNVGKRKS
jgi:hypothetical protein